MNMFWCCYVYLWHDTLLTDLLCLVCCKHICSLCRKVQWWHKCHLARKALNFPLTTESKFVL